MKTKPFITAAATFIILAGGLAWTARHGLTATAVELPPNTSQATAPQDDSKQQLLAIAQLSHSPIASTTRTWLDTLAATSTKARATILARFPFKNVSSFTDSKLQSKFIVINGSEIPSVGAQIYILFVDAPDTIYRVAYQATGNPKVPLALVAFEPSQDTPADVKAFVAKLAGLPATSAI